MEDILYLVARIYDASMEPALWDPVLGEITLFLGGDSAMLLAQDFVNLDGRFFHRWNDNPDFTASFFDKYMKLNPLSPHILMSKPGDIVVASRLMPHDELRASRFFQEWVAPQGYFDFVGVTLENSGGNVANLTVGSGEKKGMVTDDQIAKMTLLAPHLRRAVSIGRLMENQQRNATLSDLFERIRVAIALVDGGGAIVYCNGPAARLIDETDVLLNQDGALAAQDRQSDRLLHDAISAASLGDDALANQGIALPLKSRSGVLYVASVLPLSSGTRRNVGRAFEARVAVFVRRAELELKSPIEVATAHYHLSHAEVRVLYSLLEIGGIAASAETLGISEATVKTHLQHIFDKTGTSRQVDLVKLVAGLVNLAAIE